MIDWRSRVGEVGQVWHVVVHEGDPDVFDATQHAQSPRGHSNLPRTGDVRGSSAFLFAAQWLAVLPRTRPAKRLPGSPLQSGLDLLNCGRAALFSGAATLRRTWCVE